MICSKDFETSFRDADGITPARLQEILSEGKKGLSEAEDLSLVKACKSPTRPKQKVQRRDLSVFEPIKEIDELKPVFESETRGPGRFTVIQYREWSNEYRIRTRVETSILLPPPPDGPRYSEMLSNRGARKITDSCYYMAAEHGGYKTFVTGTFSDDARIKIRSGRTTIQREVSRMMDSMQKMYQRGWVDSCGTHHRGHSEPLAYCWVVEIPKNKDGEDNPHVHFMMNWRVKRKFFDDWSSRIESLWGNGYFHLEKIRDPLCAGAYMAKAAGYMTKSAKQDDQGKVRGNRYGISKTARAPGWFTLTEAELGIMGRLISEINELCSEKYGQLYREKESLMRALEATPRQNTQRRAQIGKKLAETRKSISKVKVVGSKYQIILKGADAFWRFMGWAVAAGWNAAIRPCSRWLEHYDKARAKRRDRRTVKSHRWSDKEWEMSQSHFEQYEQFENSENYMGDWCSYSKHCQ